MPAPNPLKAALRRGDKQLGFWMSLGSPTAVELAANAGFDWLLIDMEHTTLSAGDALESLRAARSGGPAEPVVRVPWNDAVRLKRLLDAGARSFMVPFVQNAEEARRAVAATRYPPAGIRGVSTQQRGNDYGRTADYFRTVQDDMFIAVQIETPEAARNAAEIAAVDGVDCVFVGPNDLAANMGHIGDIPAPEVQAVIASVIEPVRAAGKAPGLLDFDLESSRRWLSGGFDVVAVGGDVSLLVSGTDKLLRSYR